MVIFMLTTVKACISESILPTYNTFLHGQSHTYVWKNPLTSNIVHENDPHFFSLHGTRDIFPCEQWTEYL